VNCLHSTQQVTDHCGDGFPAISCTGNTYTLLTAHHHVQDSLNIAGNNSSAHPRR